MEFPELMGRDERLDISRQTVSTDERISRHRDRYPVCTPSKHEMLRLRNPRLVQSRLITLLRSRLIPTPTCSSSPAGIIHESVS